MQLLYIDESGGAIHGDDQQYYVLGAVSVYEKRPYYLNNELDALCQELFPLTPDVELHASAIYNGNGEPWASLPRNSRIDILKRVYAYIADQSVCLFGVAMHKASFKSINPIQRTCEELSGHFDAALARLEADKGREKQLGLMIFDESNHARTLHVLLSQYRTTGARFGRVKHIAEVPMFADSKLTRVLQIADFVAYAIFRRYERGDSSFLDMIIHKFDEGQGRLHGLVHLITDYKGCYCPACVTRRTNP